MIGPGVRLGPFLLGEPIGAGGFATVYEAEDTRFGDRVAVKVLAPNHALNPEIRGRFLGEAQVLRRVRSHQLIRVLDVGEDGDGSPYVVLEFAAGGDLAERIDGLRAAGWRPNADDLALVTEALGGAMEALHHERIVHRDIKPSNILIRTVSASRAERGQSILGPHEELVVADLGYAKDLAVNSGLTSLGGTYGFGAPEQRTGSAVVDHRADLFAASAVLTWLVTGDAPAEHGGVGSLLGHHGYPSELASAVGRSLDPRPQGRHHSAGDWRAELLDAIERSRFGQEDRQYQGRSSPTKRRPLGRNLVLGGLALLVVISGIIGALIVILADGEDPQTLSDGRESLTHVGPDGDYQLIAPMSITVGETAVVEVVAPPQGDWILVGPDNRRYPNSQALEVQATGAGKAVVALIVTDEAGEPIATLEHTIVVDE